jgi:hypothetical protein
MFRTSSPTAIEKGALNILFSPDLRLSVTEENIAVGDRVRDLGNTAHLELQPHLRREGLRYCSVPLETAVYR